MGWKGFIGGAMQSAGKSGLEYFEAEHKSQIESDRAQRVIEMKQKYDEKARTDKVGRIETAKQGIIEESIGTKYAGSDSAVADAEAGRTDSPLTEEQKATIKLAKDTDRETLSNDPDTYLKAGMKTGDLDIEKVVAIVKQDRANAIAMRRQLHDERKLSNDERKTEIQADYNNRRLDNDSRKIDAMIANSMRSGGSGGKETTMSLAISTLEKNGATRQQINDYIMEKKSTPLEDIAAKLLSDGAARTTKDAMAMAAEMKAFADQSTQKPAAAQATQPASADGFAAFLASRKPADAAKPSALVKVDGIEAMDFNFDPANFDAVLDAAKSGGVQHKQQLKHWLTSGDLTATQRLKASAVVK